MAVSSNTNEAICRLLRRTQAYLETGGNGALVVKATSGSLKADHAAVWEPFYEQQLQAGGEFRQ